MFQDDIIFFVSKFNCNYDKDLLHLVVTPAHFSLMLSHFLMLAIFFSCWKSPTLANELDSSNMVKSFVLLCWTQRTGET